MTCNDPASVRRRADGKAEGGAVGVNAVDVRRKVGRDKAQGSTCLADNAVNVEVDNELQLTALRKGAGAGRGRKSGSTAFVSCNCVGDRKSTRLNSSHS